MRCGAFSLIELMVAVGLMSLIVLGLVMMFSQTQRAFKTSITQKDVLETGRVVTDMLSRELAEMTPSEVANTTNFYAELSSPPSYQDLPGSSLKRTNVLQRFFFLTRFNQDWRGIGYQVAPDSPNAPVGTLYRYVSPGVRGYTNHFLSADFQRALRAGEVTNRVADGIVHLRLRAFDRQGWPITERWPTNSAMETNSTRYFNPLVPDVVDSYFRSNAVPASLELDLGILEPGVLAQYRSLSEAGVQAQRQYLSNHVAQVHLFRERIPIRNADPSAYQ